MNTPFSRPSAEPCGVSDPAGESVGRRGPDDCGRDPFWPLSPAETLLLAAWVYLGLLLIVR